MANERFSVVDEDGVKAIVVTRYSSIPTSNLSSTGREALQGLPDYYLSTGERLQGHDDGTFTEANSGRKFRRV